ETTLPIYLPANIPQPGDITAADLGFKVPKGMKLSVTPGPQGAEPTFSLFDPATRKTFKAPLLGEAPEISVLPSQAFSLIQKAGLALPEEEPEAATQRVIDTVKTDTNAFLKQLRETGRTAESDALLTQMFPGITEADIAGIYAPPEAPVEQMAFLFDALPSLVTERNVGEMWFYFLENPDAFRSAMVAEGKNPMTIALMKSLYPKITDAQISDFLSLESLTIEKGVSGPKGKAAAAFTAGVGDLVANTGGVFKWLGAEGIGDKIARAGQFMQVQAKPDTLGEFNWKQLFNPEWYATTGIRLVPNIMALAIPGVGAYGLAGSIAGKVALGAVGRAIITGIGGGALSRPVESAMEAASAYDQARAKGLSHEEAEQVANKVFKNNLTLAGLDAAQIAVAFMPMPVKLRFGNAIARGLVRTAMVGGKLVVIGLTEGGEEFSQEMMQLSAMGDKRGLTELLKEPFMQEVFALGALMGVGMGAGGDILMRVENRIVQSLTPKQRAQVDTSRADFVAQGMADEVAFTKALDQLLNKVPEVAKVVPEIVKQVEQEITLEQLKPKTAADEVALDHLKEQLAPTPEEVAPVPEIPPEAVAPKAAVPGKRFVMDITEPTRGVPEKPHISQVQVTPVGDYVVGQQPSQYGGKANYAIWDKQGKLIRGGFEKHSDAMASAKAAPAVEKAA
ncbi:MAG: hypothetical protein Q8O55_03740, partial [Dehalococcoidales bacterium]|nr:hypothetical protein [Dehalococcoidales bacterium]